MINLQMGWLLVSTLLAAGIAGGTDFAWRADGSSTPTLAIEEAKSEPLSFTLTATDDSANGAGNDSPGLSQNQVADETGDGWWDRLSNALVWVRDIIRDVLLPVGVVALGLGLILGCTLAWLLNLVALPGNWLAIALMAMYAWLGPETGRWQLGLASLTIAFVLGLVGELVEFLAGAMGASRAGASRRATLMAIVGSILGAIAGGIVGLPIPVVGPVLAAILFGGLGATAGAMFAEWNDGKAWRENWRIGQAAFWGRTTGTVGKMVAGLLILVVCAFGVFF
ncbi:MAG: DUF456 domain-containing protein [Rhodopirellula sp. JB055]|uniref:DUF456 domain-containing protein n=1 Tax=Rhodopirellula sp. JB055 TaxID=3342846 RepID=UPI00370CBFA3